MTELILWRHGRSEWNVSGRFQGQQESDLDATGREQVRAVAPLLEAYAPTRLLSSNARRALDSAAALADVTGLAVESDSALREIALGGWEGLTRPEIEASFPAEYAAWAAGEDVRRGAGETYAECGARAWAFIQPRLDGASGPVVVVTHGGTTRGLLSVLLDLTAGPGWPFAALRNAHWARLQHAPTGWRLLEYNAVTVDVGW